MPTHARDRLVAAAEQLFYAEGIRAVGVERLLEASGVGRASFYRHFASKDDLVVTMLRGYDERFKAWFTDALAATVTDPPTFFDTLAERCAAAGFRGCASINTTVEMVDPDNPAFRVAVEHKQNVLAAFDEWLAEAGRPDHERLAQQFLLLLDGVLVTAQRDRTPDAAHRAKTIASMLLATPPDASAAG